MELQTNVKTGDINIKEGTTAPIQQVITKEPDLITRVSQVKTEVTQPTGEIKEPEFDFKDIEKIQDPAAKDYAEKAYKSFKKGFNQKFHEIADIRKSLEKQVSQDTGWTPEKIQGLLNNPEFIKAAQQVTVSQAPSNFSGTQEEWSTLNEQEKAEFKSMRNEITALKQQNFQVQLKQQDEQFKSKYANYNPEAIDIITAEMLAGKVNATREHLWKVLDYDDAVNRAYQLGKQDRGVEVKEKVGASSIEGMSTTENKDAPKPEKDENPRAFWNRIVQNASLKAKGEIRK
jgi:hypothetical protein